MHIFASSIPATYTGADATFEILIMLAGAGLIGYFLHYRVCAIRGCCHGSACARCAAVQEKPSTVTTIVPAQPTAPLMMPVPTAPVVHRRDNLELIEGVGPKVRQVLNDAQVFSFAQVAAMTPAALKAILDRAGDRFRILQTESWPIQAALARDGKSKELEEYQEFLVAGREPESH